MQKTTPDSPPNFALTRRSFLAGGAAFAGTAAVATGPAFADGVKEFALTPAPATLNLVGEQWPKTDVWCFNGRVPGPEIRARQGDRVRIRLANGLAQPTTVHWHGLRIPNAMDGVPDLTQAPVPPGGSFVYEFTLPDAGTFWYHPHVLSSEQVGRGLYGPLIVEEANPPRVDRDLTWVIDDWRLTKDAAIADDFNHPMHLSHGGRTGNTITVNGKPIDTFSVRAGERIRLRLISTANARIFSLHFKGHAPTLIAFDGQPVEPHAAPGGRVTLGSGQRVDLILDAAGKPGEKMEIVDDYYQRSPYVFADIAYSNEAPLRESPLDATVSLNRNPLPELDLANAETHPVRIEGGAMGRMDSAIYKGRKMGIRELSREMKIWSINGVVAHTAKMPPMLTLKKGRTYILQFRNDTSWPHPMHLHGQVFHLLLRNGKPVAHRPAMDTIFLEPGETVEAGIVADNPGDWLFHCHILEHHQAGMASVIRVA